MEAWPPASQAARYIVLFVLSILPLWIGALCPFWNG
jgi:hypothetical protein